MFIFAHLPLVLVLPLVALFGPGQPSPYNVFPYLAVATLMAAALIAWVVVRRHPEAGEGEGAPLSEA